MHEPWYILPNPPISAKKAIIIGGGLAGTCSAFSLAQRGFEVTLIEREPQIASAASGNPVGIITPLITHKSDLLGQFYMAGFEHSLQYIKSLKEDTGFQQCGMIQLAPDKVSKNLADIVVPEEKIQHITAKEASIISGLDVTFNALYLPDCAIINPAQLCHANSAHPAITVQCNTDALSLEREGGLWNVRTASGTLASAPVVVVANSADALAFEQLDWLPLQKVRGQITYLPGGAVQSRTILCYNGGYLSPEIAGNSYVGATYNRTETTLAVSDEEHDENLFYLRAHLPLPALDSDHLHGRAAFRAALPDRRAAIGQVPDRKQFMLDYSDLHHGRYKADYPTGTYHEGLYVSVGHGSRGLTSCPIGGEMLAAMICGEPLPLEQEIVNTLNPARFLLRELKRKA